MSRIRWLSLIVGAFGAPALHGLQPPPELIQPESLLPELAALIEAMNEASPALESGRLQLQARGDEQQIAEAADDTRLTLYGRVGPGYEFRSDIDNTSRVETVFNFAATKPLYHWGAVEDRQAASEERRRAARFDLQRLERDTVGEVRNVYLRWVWDNLREETLLESIELMRSLRESAEQLLALGQGSELDLLDVEVRLREREELLGWIRNDRTWQASRLRELTGLDDLSPYAPDADSFSFPLPGLELIERVRHDLVGADWETSPEMRRNAALLRAEELEGQALGARKRPLVDLVASAYTDRVSAVNENDDAFRVNTFIGFQVSWDIWNGQQTDALRRASLTRQRLLEVERRETELRLRSQAERLIAALELNMRQTAVREARVEVNRRRLGLAEQESQRGLRTRADVLQVQVDYEQSRQEALESRFYFLFNASALRALYETSAPDSTDEATP